MSGTPLIAAAAIVGASLMLCGAGSASAAASTEPGRSGSGDVRTADPSVPLVSVVVARSEARMAAKASLAITTAGLPGDQRPALLLRGPHVRRAIASTHAILHGLRPGRYVLTVRPVVLGHGSHSVRAGARAFPTKRRIVVTVRANRTAKAMVLYGTVVNPGVRSLPHGLIGVLGPAGDPRAIVLSGRSAHPGVGTILTSGPTALLPAGLISKVMAVRRQHGRLVVALVAVPVTDAVPELSFGGALPLTPAHGAAQGAGASIPAQTASLPRARRAGACGLSTSSSLLRFGAHLDSVELRQASLGAWPPQMKLTLAVRTTETLGLGTISRGLDCSWKLAEIGPFDAVIPAGPIPIPVYATLPVTIKLSLKGSVQAGSINVASTTVAHVAAGFDENAASLSEQGSNVWATGPSVSGSASLLATIGVQAGIGISKAGNVHVEAAFGPEFDVSTGLGCNLHIDLGSLSAGVEAFGRSLDTPSFTPFEVPLWSGCQPAGGGSGSGGSGGSGGGGTSGGGQIAGRVTDTSGGGVAGVYVGVLQASGEHALVGYAQTDNAGDYTISNLPAGEFDVGFLPSPEGGYAFMSRGGGIHIISPTGAESRYAFQYYNGRTTLAAAERITIQAGATVENVDARLALSGRIAGTVTGEGGQAIGGAEVCAYELAAGIGYGLCALTDKEGHYTISGLAAGSYVVEFAGPEGSAYMTQFWNGKLKKSEAGEVIVEAGHTHEGVDAAMAV